MEHKKHNMATSRQDILKYLAAAGILVILTSYIVLYLPVSDGREPLQWRVNWNIANHQDGGSGNRSEDMTEGDNNLTVPEWQQPNDHPISELRDGAYKRLTNLLESRSTTLEQAAQQYRAQRGRHPPPGFDAWFAAAAQMDSVVVESFFDRIYHDLAPFWAKDPLKMRRRARTQPQRIQVRKGQASFVADWTGYQGFAKRMDWMELWTDAVKEVAPHLPDLDMVVNAMDESRILVPWDDIERYIAVERRSRRVFPTEEAITQYTAYNDLDAELLDGYQPKWVTGQAHKYWEYVKSACSPDSPARQENISAFDLASESVDDIYPSYPSPAYTRRGFISNFTTARDACQQPWLRSLHGTYVEPGAMSTLTSLDLPMFGGSKLAQNNEILIPGAMYLTDEARYSGGGGHGGPWNQKKDGLVWRGVSSGGRSTANNWWRFHRHRFVQMLNGSAVTLLEDGADTTNPKMTFGFPQDGNHTHSDSTTPNSNAAPHLGAFLSEFADVGFVSMDCHPSEYSFWGRRIETCPYTDDYYALKPKMSMTEQYDFKFLPDVDGNSFSARWRAFLLSSSLPLKATVYTEWHDDRLIPWLHFVPFDNSFADIYSILDYFQKHDEEAQRIADEGQAWAKRVLRREDMVLYVWRLLLEYARVMDPSRDKLAYVEDLTSNDRRSGQAFV